MNRNKRNEILWNKKIVFKSYEIVEITALIGLNDQMKNHGHHSQNP